MRVFPPSTVPHVWRTTWATFSIIVWFMLAVYWLFDKPVLWLLRLHWWGDNPFGTMDA